MQLTSPALYSPTLGPAQGREVEQTEVAFDLALQFHAAPDDAEQVDDDLVLENAVIGGLDTVQRFAAHGNDGLELGGTAQLA